MKAKDDWKNLPGQMTIFDFLGPDSWCGKTYQEPSVATKEKTLEQCSKKQRKSSVKMPLFLDLRGGIGHLQDALWETGGPLLGEYMMHSFGECPKEENVSLLSQILEDQAHPKYSLSAKACQGILNRAERRGKTLPEQLYQALKRQLVFKNDQESQGGGQKWKETEVCDTLNIFDNSETRTPVIIIENHPQDSRWKICEDNVFQTLSSSMGTGGGNVPMIIQTIKNEIGGALSIGNGQIHDAMSPSYEICKTLNCMDDPMKIVEEKNMETVVRRLTPLECERLQGYPDGWTDIGDWIDSKGKKHKGDSDAPRYKALGNSIALPFWEWMAERIVAQYDRPTTMASLFDGIGGFPLVFSRCGCTPVWASEIEEFPIAVTKVRFPEEE
jgi:DNA (cytosine-5)-methyltransferase 1